MRHKTYSFVFSQTGWSAVVAAEAVFFDILVGYWAGDALPQGASRMENSFLLIYQTPNRSVVTIFIAATTAIFLLPNKAFAWFEYVTSLIKVALFIIIIIIGLALIGRAGLEGSVHIGSNWTELPAFKNGFFV